MAFCRYCGKALNEGEVCNCEGAQRAAQQVQSQAQPVNFEAQSMPQMNQAQYNGTQNMNQAQYNGAQNMNQAQYNGTQANQGMPQFNSEQMQQKANEYMQQGKAVAGSAWKNLLNIFKAPASGGREYVNQADMVISLVLIAVQAVIAGIFGMILSIKVNSLISSAFLGYNVGSGYKFSVVKGLFLTIIFSLIISAVFAVLVLAGGKIAKADMNMKKALAVTSIRSAAVLPFMAAGCILTLLNVAVGACVFYLGGVFVTFFVYAALTGIVSENKLPYVLAAIMVVFAIATSFIMGSACSMYLPKNFKSISSILKYLS
jgi:hypothetical protein